MFDLTSNRLRPAGWTSADAAGLPIFPGLVRYDEVVEQGEIRHALRFTVKRTQRGYVAPATHWASASKDRTLPPMGLRVRLRADYDISRFPKPAQVILTCLKRYGMLLADNGATGSSPARRTRVGMSRNWRRSSGSRARTWKSSTRERSSPKGIDRARLLTVGMSSC